MTFPSSQVYDWDMYNIKKDILKKQKSIRDKKGGRLRSASFKMRLECKIIAYIFNLNKEKY